VSELFKPFENDISIYQLYHEDIYVNLTYLVVRLTGALFLGNGVNENETI
jgi:hypothetical protein